jgi:beta-galactosidase
MARFLSGRRYAFACLLFAATGLLAQAVSAAEPRVSTELQNGWRFKQASGLLGVESAAFDDRDWSEISLPHTWNRIGNSGVELSPDANHVQGTGWYRLRFTPPAAPAGSRYFLQFDGVGEIASVWLNGHFLGRHSGAFARFRFDATAALKPASENLLVVEADNSKPAPQSTTADVIPLSGDFFIFGGLYRNVSLIVTNPVHLDMLDFGGPGIYARATAIGDRSATVQVVSRLKNDDTAPRSVIVRTEILDAADNLVKSQSRALVLAPGKTTESRTNLAIASPHLWQGVKDPYLYHTTVTLFSPKNAVLDQVGQPLGLRTIRFDADRGFFLNGEHLFLKGVSMHQDRPVKGWAISRADQEEDFNVLMDMGANAVRMAHYQHDQYSYELADKRGIVIWAELPLVNQVSFDGSPANTALSANARQQLIELIRQNYNHPSIALWSVGNEIDLRASQNQGPSKAAPLVRALDQLAKAEDPARPTTLADCCESAGPVPTAAESLRDQLVGLTDVAGYNRYFGWYRGMLSDLGPFLDGAHRRHPNLPIAVSEYGAGAALSQHSDNSEGGPINPHGRPHPEEVQDLYHEQSWAQLKGRAYLWGAFIWNMFDFSSLERHEGDLTDINEKGLVSYDRQTRKDAFYFYRANWSSQPTLHLVGRRYTDRAYGVVDVKAYSNAAQATLSLNGTTAGTTPCVDGICIWPSVHLVAGNNVLFARADASGTTATDTMAWNFAGSLARIHIKAGDISGYRAEDGTRFGSDNYFAEGEGYGVNPPDTPVKDRMNVSATDPALYDSFREGRFTYSIPVPNGRYRVVMKFEEPSANTAGERIFDVVVNGAVALDHFDIFAAAGGKLKGIERSFETRAADGKIVIEFRPVTGKALVSAVSIMPVSGGSD